MEDDVWLSSDEDAWGFTIRNLPSAFRYYLSRLPAFAIRPRALCLPPSSSCCLSSQPPPKLGRPCFEGEVKNPSNCHASGNLANKEQ